MDVKDPILHGMRGNNLDSFVAASENNSFVVDLEGQPPSLSFWRTLTQKGSVGGLWITSSSSIR